MALKAILENVDGLPEDVKKEYKKGDDGKFHLDVDGIDSHPGVAVLKRSMDNAKSERTAAQTEARTAREALQAAQDELDNLRRGAIPKADVEALETSWKNKLKTATDESTAKITKLTGAVDKNVRQAAAASLAAEVFLNPALGLPHVLPRLTVVEDGDDFVVKVLDTAGKPSALTLDEFKKEILQNKDLAPILRGTRASGGGAGGGAGGGGAPSDKDFDAAKATPKDLAARITARKQAEGG
jgi:hypothetical protein